MRSLLHKKIAKKILICVFWIQIKLENERGKYFKADQGWKAGRPYCSLLDIYGSQSIFKLSEINSIFFLS